MSEVVIDGVRYVPEIPIADEVSIYGMYDMHLFHRITGKTVDEIIKNWLRHNAQKQPAIVGNREVDDMGPSSLCPATVMKGDKELRRVGRMVFANYENRKKPHSQEALDEYRKALLSDPDIPRLLGATEERSKRKPAKSKEPA